MFVVTVFITSGVDGRQSAEKLLRLRTKAITRGIVLSVLRGGIGNLYPIHETGLFDCTYDVKPPKLGQNLP